MNAIFAAPTSLLLVACLAGAEVPVAAAAPNAAPAQDSASIAAPDIRAFADALFSRGLHRQAAAEYRRYLSVAPDAPDADGAAFRLGEALRLCGEREEAAKAYRLAAERPGSPWRSKALFKRASLFAELGRNDAAEEMYGELLESGPDPEVRELALHFRAAALESLGRASEAAAMLEEQLSAFPDGPMSSWGRLALGRVCGSPGPAFRPDRARELLRGLSDPSSNAEPRLAAEALFILGHCESAAERWAEAADAFEALRLRYPDDPRAPECLNAAARAAARAGRHVEAVALCDEALAATPPPQPGPARALRWLRATSLLELSRLEEAQAAFAALAADSGADTDAAARAAYQSALCAWKRGRWAEAATAVGPALRSREVRAEALWLLAEASAALADSAPDGGAEPAARAVESYRAIAAEFPDAPFAADALYRLGHRLMRGGAPADAAAAWVRLAESANAGALAPRARFAAASALAAAGRGSEALTQWQTLLRDFPDCDEAPEALFQEALEEMREERRVDAIRSFETLLRRFPDHARSAEAKFWRGEALRSGGDLRGAEASYRDALASSPNESVGRDARFALAAVLRETGRDEESAEIFAGLLDSGADAGRFPPGLLAWLSARQCADGDAARAADSARLLAQSGPTDEWKQTGWTLLGRAERQAGHPREAEEAFDKAHSIGVEGETAAEAALRLGELRLARGDAAGADAPLRAAVRLAAAPDKQGLRVRAYVALGRAALAAGNSDAAARYLLTVCMLYRDPEELPPVMLETIRLLEGLGRTEEARSLRETLRADYPGTPEAEAAAK